MSVRALEQCIDELPASCRTVFVLLALEEMPEREACEALGVSLACVRARYAQARRRIGEALLFDLPALRHAVFGFDGARCDRTVRAVLARTAPGVG